MLGFLASTAKYAKLSMLIMNSPGGSCTFVLFLQRFPLNGWIAVLFYIWAR